MFETWRNNILANLNIVERNTGPSLVTIVSGTESDRAYWQERLNLTRRDVFREDGDTLIVATSEEIRKGNFLGTFQAWLSTQKVLERTHRQLPNVALMSMVFGKGKRLSPFTQSMGNRKSAFLSPMRAKRIDTYLCTADLSNLYANLWLEHLDKGGFRGLVVKWGDEAIIPGKEWQMHNDSFGEVDAVRFVWKTEVTEDFAREKDWVAIDSETGLMRHQYARQDKDSLMRRFENLDNGTCQIGVNLGSLALSYEFLDIAIDVLQTDVLTPDLWADWDPYVWIALCCRSESEWKEELEHERRIGSTKIIELEARYPNFYRKIADLRNELESKTGRPFAVGVVDFGEAYWVDIGLHITLRKTLESLTQDTERGRTAREFFGIPHHHCESGNIVINSEVPQCADIKNSVIINSTIFDARSVIHQGVIVNSQLQVVHMPYGGSVLFSDIDQLEVAGPHAIAYGAVGHSVTMPDGGRQTTLFLPDGLVDLRTNESVVDYKEDNYSQPILDNSMSFEEAEKAVSRAIEQGFAGPLIKLPPPTALHRHSGKE